MATFEILIPGYVEDGDDGEHVGSAISLIESGSARIIVDPGMTKGNLTVALKDRGLDIVDVTHVFLTHHHVDHTRNVGLFPDAIVVDVDSIYHGDIWDEQGDDKPFGVNDVWIEATPGHSEECATLFAQTEAGTVAFTHAWWFSDLSPLEDPMATNQDQLEVSRRTILSKADLIVAGHAKEPHRVQK